MGRRRSSACWRRHAGRLRVERPAPRGPAGRRPGAKAPQILWAYSWGGPPRAKALGYQPWVTNPMLIRRSGGGLELGDDELLHAHHGLHGLGVLDELGQAGGHDLPGEAELVLEPAAGDFGSAGGELRPVIVDFVLGVAADYEGDCVSELVRRAAVERGRSEEHTSELQS